MDFFKKLEGLTQEDQEGGSGASHPQGQKGGFSDLLHTASSLLSSSQDKPHHSAAPPSHGDPTAHRPTGAGHSAYEEDAPDSWNGSGGKPTQGHAPGPGDQQGPAGKPAYGDLLASAKVVLEAAQGKGGADKAKLAGAAASILGAASTYGKLEDQQYGEYIRKAQDYLQSYESKQGQGAGYGAPVSASTAHGQPPTTHDPSPAHHPKPRPTQEYSSAPGHNYQSTDDDYSAPRHKYQSTDDDYSAPRHKYQSTDDEYSAPRHNYQSTDDYPSAPGHRPTHNYDAAEDYPSAHGYPPEEHGIRPGYGHGRAAQRPPSSYDSPYGED
ncbi:hypothetical protein O6H91_10G060400 [Diphasiastrum complanatum]|uniref:Uncharacterized protein n=1 Tax=Diphasiastrum complanatum TaxID=34168 RepID=A0ACC2CHH8_DIPCM|nr:hypothetical protein O6H91_10G060400 [Diphasiastrum complanatum]